MTHQLDVARGRDIVARWCALAERRLDYLTELFETGRWRRYHSELAFLENIQEAKSAVEIWRDLSTREASRNNSAIDISWLGHGRAMPSRGESLRDQVHGRAEIAAAAPSSAISIVPEAGRVYSAQAPSVSETGDAPTTDFTAIAQRYPLLRNAL
jgi:uncharacterized repeat protein (TIGR03809 family)